MYADSEPNIEDAARATYTRFVGSLVLLASLVVGIGMIFTLSYQSWGSLPGASGGGLIVYAFVGAGVIAMVGYVVWTWLAWRSSLH